MSPLRILLRVTRAYSLSGMVGGFLLGGLLPLALIPLTLLNLLHGRPAEFSTVLLVAVVSAMTGAVIGLAVGLIAGILSSLLTLALDIRTGTPAHRNLLRLLTVPTTTLLIFFGVTLFTGSTDMSLQTVLIWRVPPTLLAAAYGWWLAGRMARHDHLWLPDAYSEDTIRDGNRD